jgi:hypothetical protein
MVWVTVLESGESNPLDPIVSTLNSFSFGLTAKDGTSRDVPQHTAPGKNSVSLEDIANPGVNALDWPPHHLNFTNARSLQTRNETQGRGFTTTSWTNHRTEFPWRDLQTEIP